MTSFMNPKIIDAKRPIFMRRKGVIDSRIIRFEPVRKPVDRRLLDYMRSN